MHSNICLSSFKQSHTFLSVSLLSSSFTGACCPSLLWVVIFSLFLYNVFRASDCFICSFFSLSSVQSCIPSTFTLSTGNDMIHRDAITPSLQSGVEKSHLKVNQTIAYTAKVIHWTLTLISCICRIQSPHFLYNCWERQWHYVSLQWRKYSIKVICQWLADEARMNDVR